MANANVIIPPVQESLHGMSCVLEHLQTAQELLGRYTSEKGYEKINARFAKRVRSAIELLQKPPLNHCVENTTAVTIEVLVALRNFYNRIKQLRKDCDSVNFGWTKETKNVSVRPLWISFAEHIQNARDYLPNIVAIKKELKESRRRLVASLSQQRRSTFHLCRY